MSISNSSANAGGSPNIWSSAWIIISLELERAFFSRQGFIYLAAFIFIWGLLLKLGIFNEILLSLNPMAGNQSWSSTVFSHYFRLSLYAFPLLCLLIAANQTATDRERGTLRFLLLRCSRSHIFFARFLSQVVIQYTLILISLIMTLAMGSYLFGFSPQALAHAFNAGANLWLIILPFIALMALLSVVVKSPRQATFLAALICSAASLLINVLSHYAPSLAVINFVLPGMQFSELLGLAGAEKFTLAYIPLLQCVLLLLVGRFIMHRKSL
ncbi:MAG: ABC transporter permease subunit [Bermanella sp.]